VALTPFDHSWRDPGVVIPLHPAPSDFAGGSGRPEDQPRVPPALPPGDAHPVGLVLRSSFSGWRVPGRARRRRWLAPVDVYLHGRRAALVIAFVLSCRRVASR